MLLYNECDSTDNIISAIDKQESIQLSISRHSDELKEIFEAIPNNDSEVLNRSSEVLFSAFSTQMQLHKFCTYGADFSIYRYLLSLYLFTLRAEVSSISLDQPTDLGRSKRPLRDPRRAIHGKKICTVLYCFLFLQFCTVGFVATLVFA